MLELIESSSAVWENCIVIQDLVFSAGERIQLYCRTSHIDSYAWVRNFRILGDTCPDKFDIQITD